MSPFSTVLAQKKHAQSNGKNTKARKPFVLIWNTAGSGHLQDIADALESLAIPYEIQSTEESFWTTSSTAAALKRADIVVFFQPKQEFYAAASQNLCVPVAPRVSETKTKDYNAVLEKGDGFYFAPENKWEIFAALIRACETFQFPYDWENLLREIHGSRL